MNIIPLAQPDITEIERDLVLQVLNGQTLSRGPMLAQFEKQFAQLTKCQHAIGVSSGTSGLILALHALGVQAKDEVITVSYTVPATVNAILSLAATPILVDIDKTTRGMCPQALEAAITDRTRAVIVVHAFGQAADITAILSICNTRGIPLIEDACEAIGNSYHQKPLGSWGDIGVFGFYANKQITCGEGGMIVTNNSHLAEKLRKLRNNGRSMNGHWLDQEMQGYNARLNEISAAIGVAQLQRFEHIKQRRQTLAQCYQQQLQDNPFIQLPQFSEQEQDSLWFAYVVNLNIEDVAQRDIIYQAMYDDGIQCGRYFAPVHWQPFFKQKYGLIQLATTEKLSVHSLVLPFYNELSAEKVNYITERLKSHLNLS